MILFYAELMVPNSVIRLEKQHTEWRINKMAFLHSYCWCLIHHPRPQSKARVFQDTRSLSAGRPTALQAVSYG